MPKLTEILAKHFTVFTYDRRGRGDSGDTQPYNIQREIEDIEALIREAGGSAYMFAMSSGAVLALYAVAAGLNISRLSLYEPPFIIGTNGHRPPKDHEIQLKQLLAAGRKGDAVKFYLAKVIGAPAFLPFILRLTPNWSKMKSVAGTLPYDAAIMGDFHLPTDVVSSVDVPAIVISGGKSAELLRKAAQAVVDKMPNAQLRILKGQSHNVSVKVLAPVLVEFFKLT
jgi:pimeloyl-ACP methyl ester carboxylesterase